MNKNEKKLLCSVIAACMLASSLPAFAAPTYYTQDFSDASTGGTGYGWLSNYQVGGMNWSTTSGWTGAFNASGDYQYNFSIADGVLGKAEGDKAWKWSLKQNAGSKTIRLNETTNTTDGNTFYMQSTIYLDTFTSPNVFRTGGESYLGSARKLAYLSFGPDGKIYKDNTIADSNVLIDQYQPKNWYTVTMAFTAQNGVTNAGKVYIDGKEIETYAFDGSAGEDAVSNAYMVNGWQYDTNTTPSKADNPFWAMLDDFKVVEGTFNPETENPDITSDTYTVANPTFLQSGSRSEAKISGISNNTTVAELLENITPPAGGTVRVVTINNQTDVSVPLLDSDDLKTVAAAETDVLTPAHKLISEAAGNALKIYDLEVEEPSAYEAEITSSEYVINGDEKTISTVARGTSISRFKGGLTPSYGATVKVVDVRGVEMTEGYINNNLRVVVTSYDGAVINEYSVAVDTSMISDYRGSNSHLLDMNVGLIQKLIGYGGATIDDVIYSGAGSNRRNNIAGFYGGNWSNVPSSDTTTEATFSKVIDTDGEAAYEFTNNSKYNIYRALSGRTLVPYNNKDKGDNIVLKYSIRPMAAGRYVAAWDIIAADANGKEYSNHSNEPILPQIVTGRATPNISFQTDDGVNNIRIGVRKDEDGWNAKIGEWEVGKKYDVVIVVKKLDASSDGYYIKNVSINGNEINLADTGLGTQNGEYFKLNNSNNFQSTYASYVPSSIATDPNRNAVKSWSWNTINFSVASADGVTPGKVNYNDIEIYTANDYVEETDISLSSKTLEVYEEDQILKRATIKGFAGTVETLENTVTMPEGAFLVVRDAEGNILGKDAVLQGGMNATVYSADSSSSKTYLLSDAIDLGKYYLFDSTGFLPVDSIEDTDGALTVQKTIKKYNLADITTFTMIIAIYDRDTNQLQGIDFVTEEDYNETDGLILTVDLTKYDTSKIYVKTMLLDSFNCMKPLCGSMILAENVQDPKPNATNQ